MSAASSVRSPFHPGNVKVFRNRLNGDLRLVTTTNYGLVREIDRRVGEQGYPTAVCVDVAGGSDPQL